jgi:hypothetical protein
LIFCLAVWCSGACRQHCRRPIAGLRNILQFGPVIDPRAAGLPDMSLDVDADPWLCGLSLAYTLHIGADKNDLGKKTSILRFYEEENAG